MKTTRDLSLIAMFSALLLGAQFALSFVAGVELVTVLLLTFSAVFGTKRGVTTAIIFSLLRCIIFGAIPTVIVLYLTYYTLFALVTAACGKIKNFKIKYPIMILAASVLTVCFTLLDNVISPAMLGFNQRAWLMYFYAGLPVMFTQTVCAFVSVAVLFPPLNKLLEKLKIAYFSDNAQDAPLIEKFEGK